MAESVLRIEMGKLAQRVVDLEHAIRAGKIGPRTARARARFLEQDRKKLEAKFKKES